MATLSQNTAIETALATLQPLKDLSRNWDVDIASWYVVSAAKQSFQPEMMTMSFVHSCDAHSICFCVIVLRNTYLKSVLDT